MATKKRIIQGSCCACGKVGHMSRIGYGGRNPQGEPGQYVCPLWPGYGDAVQPDSNGRCGTCGYANFAYSNGQEFDRTGKVRGYRCVNCGNIKPEGPRSCLVESGRAALREDCDAVAVEITAGVVVGAVHEDAVPGYVAPDDEGTESSCADTLIDAARKAGHTVGAIVTGAVRVDGVEYCPEQWELLERRWDGTGDGLDELSLGVSINEDEG